MAFIGNAARMGSAFIWNESAATAKTYSRNCPRTTSTKRERCGFTATFSTSNFLEGIPGAANPYAKVKASTATMAEVFDSFIKAECPQMDWKPRTGNALEDEKKNIKFLRKWRGWTEQPAAEVRTSTLKRYAVWRKANSKRMKNGRRIDMEIQTLKAALHNAVSDDLIKVNPLATMDLGTFQTGEVAHCKHRRPENAEQLHALARYMFERKRGGTRSQILGFQCLFEAFTGVRTSEALRCRWNAKYGEPGFI